MNKHEQHDYTEELDHSIIEHPYQYQIVEMVYHVDLKDRLNSYIDLTLIKDSTIRHLRFWGPQNLQIEKGFPRSIARRDYVLGERCNRFGCTIKIMWLDASFHCITEQIRQKYF